MFYSMLSSMEGSQCQTEKYKLMYHSMMSSMEGSQCQTEKKYKLICHSMRSSVEGSQCQTNKIQINVSQHDVINGRFPVSNWKNTNYCVTAWGHQWKGPRVKLKKYQLKCHSMMSSMINSQCHTKKHIYMYQWGGLWCFLPLLRCFNPAEPVVEKSVIL